MSQNVTSSDGRSETAHGIFNIIVFTPKKEGYLYCKRLIELNPRDKISKWSLEVDDTKELTVEYMNKRLSMMDQVSLVVIDYLQLIGGDNRENILHDLKALSEKYAIPFLILSNISRSCENREDHRPRLSDLVERIDAEIFDDIIMLYRADYYRNVDVQDDQEAELIVVKHPQIEGIPQTITLSYNSYAGGFTNCTHIQK